MTLCVYTVAAAPDCRAGAEGFLATALPAPRAGIAWAGTRGLLLAAAACWGLGGLTNLDGAAAVGLLAALAAEVPLI